MTNDPDTNARIGVLTTNPVKERMYIDLLTRFKSGSVEFYENYRGDRLEMAKQLREYRYEFKKGKDDFSRSKMVLTGKSSYQSDDIAIAMQLLAYWSSHYFSFPHGAVKYQDHQLHQGGGKKPRHSYNALRH